MILLSLEPGQGNTGISKADVRKMSNDAVNKQDWTLLGRLFFTAVFRSLVLLRYATRLKIDST